MRRVRRIRVVRRRRRRGNATDAKPEISKNGSGVIYRAVAVENTDGGSLVKAEAAPVRRRPVLPINERYLASVTVGILGRPTFREWLCRVLNLTTGITLAFEREGPVTSTIIEEISYTGVVLVDGESGRQMALRAPVRNPDDALGGANVVLIADPADFKPPHQVSAVIGRHWSVLLVPSAENPLRLGRAIQNAAEGKSTIDAGMDPENIRIADELSARAILVRPSAAAYTCLSIADFRGSKSRPAHALISATERISP